MLLVRHAYIHMEMAVDHFIVEPVYRAATGQIHMIRKSYASNKVSNGKDAFCS